MFLKQIKSHNKIYLSFVQGYRDENGKIKYRTIEKLERNFSPDKIINSLKNYTILNIEHDICLQNNCDNLIEEISKIYNLNLDKKYRTLSEIKKILNLTK